MDNNSNFSITSLFTEEQDFYYVSSSIPSLIFSLHVKPDGIGSFNIEWFDEHGVHQYREVHQLGSLTIKPFCIEAITYLKLRGYSDVLRPLPASEVKDLKSKLVDRFNNLNRYNKAKIDSQYIRNGTFTGLPYEANEHVSVIVQPRRISSDSPWQPKIIVRIKHPTTKSKAKSKKMFFESVKDLETGWDRVCEHYINIHDDNPPAIPHTKKFKTQFINCQYECHRRNCDNTQLSPKQASTL